MSKNINLENLNFKGIFRFKKKEDKKKNNSNPNTSNPCGQEKLVSKDGASALKNNLIAQNNVDLKNQREVFDDPELQKSFKRIKSDDFGACGFQYINFVENYVKTLSDKKDIEDLKKYLKLTQNLYLNNDNHGLDIFSMTEVFEGNQVRENVKVLTELVQKTYEITDKPLLLGHIFKKISKSNSKNEEKDLWLEILNKSSTIQTPVNGFMLYLATSPKEYNNTDEKTKAAFWDLLKKYDCKIVTSNIQNLLKLPPEQIKSCERFLIKNSFKRYCFSTDDLYHLSFLSDKEVQKIDKLIKWEDDYSTEHIKGKTLYKVAKNDEKLLKSIEIFINNDSDLQDFEVEKLANIPEKYVEKIDEKLINEKKWKELKSVFYILSSTDDEKMVDFMLKIGHTLHDIKSSEIRDTVLNSDFVALAVKTTQYGRDALLKKLNELSDDVINNFDRNLDNPDVLKFMTEKVKEIPNCKDSIFAEVINDSQNSTDFDSAIKKLLGEKTEIENFVLNDKLSDVVELSKDLNANEILALVKYFEKNINSDNSNEVKAVTDEIKFLKDLKDKNGNYFFRDIKSGDRVKKGSFYGLINILEAKKNNKEKYQLLKDIITLVQEGKLPRHIISVMALNGEITDLAKADINKVLSKEALVKSYKDNETAFSNTQKGDVVEVGEKLFANNGKDLTELGIDKEAYEKLFSAVERFGFGQGKVGNCYLVSALYDMMRNPDSRIELYKMFKQDGNDIVITFPDKSLKPVRFKNFETDIKSDEHISSAKGIQMLESAYKSVVADLNKIENKMENIEGGKQIIVYDKFLFGKSSCRELLILKDKKEVKKAREKQAENIAIMDEKIDDEIDKLIKEVKKNNEKENNNQNKSSITEVYKKFQQLKLGSPEQRLRMLNDIKCYVGKLDYISEDEFFDKLEELYKDPNIIISCGTKNSKETNEIPEKLIRSGHAYSIIKVDPKKRSIEVVNPWNCAQKIELSYDEFKANFSAIDYAKIK